ncbi:ABC transporter substrate-binding protein [Salinispira pacifica]|uniref:Oligopeptide ABC transporter, periplasmic oligopeptide-binding protein OppA n=1 Tax=Salinispira pacifica TaxID=1307761 RepID=V5WFB1_9SPIO|nr:ABC transporter substrate-binding protein [Salinispira pacifica]AHC14483.1 Oligopeptide ABC transporter, periplasmic oligopeptide-binding protein OppA [Salinispira pacifica]
MKKLALLVLMSAVVFSAVFAAGGAEAASSDKVVLTALIDSSDGWIRNFNPYASGAYQYNHGFTLEYIALYDPLNNNREIPWLGEEISMNDDFTSITVKLREGVKWNDGEDFNADDVVFTYKISQDHPEIDRQGYWGDNGKLLDVVKIDEYTVRWDLRSANRFAPTDIFAEVQMIPEHVWSEVAEPATHVLESPIGTGPFTEVVEFTPEMVVLGRNPYYWNADDLEIDEVRFPQFNDNAAALALLESGQVDWAHIFIPDIEKTYVQGNPNRKYWYGKNDGVRLAFNHMTKNEGNREAFFIPEFKKALSMAIDRQGIIDSAVFGYLDPVVPPVTGLPPALWGSRNPEADAITNRYAEYDLDAAREILAEAGFQDVDGDGWVETPTGQTIEFEILSPAGWSDWNDGAVIAAEGFRAIGVNASAKAPDLGVIIESWETGDHDVLYAGYGKSANPWKFYFDTIGDSSRVLTQTWWSVTQTNYVNEDINALIDRMPSASDAELKEITDEIELFFAENMINIPLFYNGLWYVYSTERFTGWSTEDNPVIEPALADHDVKLYHLMQLSPVK